MAALLEDNLLAAAPEKATSPELVEQVTRAGGDAIKSAMPDLVKGAGFSPKGGNAPLTDQADITMRAVQATADLRSAVHDGYFNKAKVVNKGFNQGFLNSFGALRTALSTPSIGEQISQVFANLPGGADALAKSFTAGNLGIGSVGL